LKGLFLLRQKANKTLFNKVLDLLSLLEPMGHPGWLNGPGELDTSVIT
jgi:hypothetical protein